MRLRSLPLRVAAAGGLALLGATGAGLLSTATDASRVARAGAVPALSIVDLSEAPLPPEAGGAGEALGPAASGRAPDSATPTAQGPGPTTLPAPSPTAPVAVVRTIPRPTSVPAPTRRPAASAPPRPVPTSAPAATPPPPPSSTPAPASPSDTQPPSSTPYSQVQVIAMIRAAATAHGVNGDCMVDLARRESGWHPNSFNPAGPYDGLFQFWPRTFRAHGGVDVWNPQQQSDVAAQMMAAGGGPGAWGTTC